MESALSHIEALAPADVQKETSAPATESAPSAEPVAQLAPTFDLSSSEWYLNRELTWLQFVERVLNEAADARNPLLERVRFLSIVGSIIDEFFMKRIGGLKQQVAAGVHERTVDGRTPKQQLQECHARIRELYKRQKESVAILLDELRKVSLCIESYSDLATEDRDWLRAHYVENIFPLVTPQAIDSAHPFPFISNVSLNLLVSLKRRGESNPLWARVKVPLGSGIPRFIQVRDTQRFVRLEDLMAGNLDLLFPGMIVASTDFFRVIRNADVERDEEEADDLLALIQSELRERKFAPIVRLDVSSNMTTANRDLLATQLELDVQFDVFEERGFLALKDLEEIAALDEPELHFPDHRPVDHPILVGSSNIFHTIREEGAILLHHPYESFSTSVERLLREASEDPKVRAIKVTLYRTSTKARLVQHLINAARNDKHVTVVVELKARFDEEANIRWASKLEEAGIHVTYGIVGLKTHCKIVLIVRQDHDGLRRYVHVSTGNYNEETAKIYGDVGLLSCENDIGRDATELFNYLTTGFKPKRNYRYLLPAPKLLKAALLDKIAREIDVHNKQGQGLIRIKTNAFEDVDICRSLYEASQAGVRVELIVRDSCRLRPGIPGLSHNISVISIVGRFLEHSRVYYFHNGGKEEYYIGSADCMTRNLTNRVEILVPVLRQELREELRFILDTQLLDPRSAWDMQPDGTYVQRGSPAVAVDGSQQSLIRWYEAKFAEETRLRKRRVRGAGAASLLDEL